MRVKDEKVLLRCISLSQRFYACRAEPAVEFFRVRTVPGREPRHRRAQKAAHHQHDRDPRRVPAEFMQKLPGRNAHEFLARDIARYVSSIGTELQPRDAPSRYRGPRSETPFQFGNRPDSGRMLWLKRDSSRSSLRGRQVWPSIFPLPPHSSSRASPSRCSPSQRSDQP